MAPLEEDDAAALAQQQAAAALSAKTLQEVQEWIAQMRQVTEEGTEALKAAFAAPARGFR